MIKEGRECPLKKPIHPPMMRRKAYNRGKIFIVMTLGIT
jgi:hypothetical protein